MGSVKYLIIFVLLANLVFATTFKEYKGLRKNYESYEGKIFSSDLSKNRELVNLSKKLKNLMRRRKNKIP